MRERPFAKIAVADRQVFRAWEIFAGSKSGGGGGRPSNVMWVWIRSRKVFGAHRCSLLRFGAVRCRGAAAADRAAVRGKVGRTRKKPEKAEICEKRSARRNIFCLTG